MSYDFNDMARILNYREHATILDIPNFIGFQPMTDENPQTVFMSRNNDGMLLQVTSDGLLSQNETVQDRINVVIDKTKTFMAKEGLFVNENTYMYCKDFKNADFDFKIYIQDMIWPQTQRVMRAFLAYFKEPRFNDFYQVSLSVGPFKMPTEQLKVGQIDLANDNVTRQMLGMFEGYLSNLKYNNN